MKRYSHPREAFGKKLVDLGKKHKNLIVLNADLSTSTKTIFFAKEFPERFFNVGVAEQSMMGVAAGLAMCEKIVIASTFAVFATGRCYDIVRQSIAYPNLNVKIVSSHGGITVGEDGASHQMLEDIALMRSLPNMRVIVPADYKETEKCVEYVVEEDGPFYVRLTRPKTPEIFSDDYQFRLGKGIVMRDGKDATIISTGMMLQTALDAADKMSSKNFDIAVIHMPSIKPIDAHLIKKYASKTMGIVTVEDHTIYNGLGSAVAEVISENHPAYLRRVGIRDVFGESGKPNDLLKRYCMTSDDICKSLEDIMKAKGV